MTNLRTRAIIASEEPEVRRLLTGVVQKDLGGVVAAQAENSIRTITLARSLRPDLVLVDYRLPHVAGVDEVRLSRIGGLDTAMAISQELPNARVLVVSDTSAARSVPSIQAQAAELCLYGQASPAQLAFADLRTRESSVSSRVDQACDKAMTVGGLAVLGGLGLMLSFIFAGAGVVLALAGAAMFTAALGVRLSAGLLLKRGRKELGDSSNVTAATARR